MPEFCCYHKSSENYSFIEIYHTLVCFRKTAFIISRKDKLLLRLTVYKEFVDMVIFMLEILNLKLILYVVKKKL